SESVAVQIVADLLVLPHPGIRHDSDVAEERSPRVGFLQLRILKQIGIQLAYCGRKDLKQFGLVVSELSDIVIVLKAHFVRELDVDVLPDRCEQMNVAMRQAKLPDSAKLTIHTVEPEIGISFIVIIEIVEEDVDLAAYQLKKTLEQLELFPQAGQL